MEKLLSHGVFLSYITLYIKDNISMVMANVLRLIQWRLG